jgi:hypothetical protein
MGAYISPTEFEASLVALRRYTELKGLGLTDDKPLVLSESAGASCGGCDNITNAFVGTLWFTAFLGEVTSMGYSQFYRQQLFGNNGYSLVSTTDEDAGLSGYHPNPDYFLSILWRRLMGATVLKVTAKNAGAAGTKRLQRVYASCSPVGKRGAVTIAFANWASTACDIEWQLRGLKQRAATKHMYVLTSDSLTSRRMRLNKGGWLVSAAQLEPKVISSSSSSVLAPAYSAGFVVLLDAIAPACVP